MTTVESLKAELADVLAHYEYHKTMWKETEEEWHKDECRWAREDISYLKWRIKNELL